MISPVKESCVTNWLVAQKLFLKLVMESVDNKTIFVCVFNNEDNSFLLICYTLKLDSGLDIPATLSQKISKTTFFIFSSQI